jgi:hypothetical protein
MKKLLIVGIAMASMFVVGCQKASTVTTTPNIDAFAKCLSGAGVKMYGTDTCPHCQAQKALFGASFQYINFIDCLKTPAVCGGISRVPTRQFKDGTMIQGEQSFATLASKTNCKLP